MNITTSAGRQNSIPEPQDNLVMWSHDTLMIHLVQDSNIKSQHLEDHRASGFNPKLFLLTPFFAFEFFLTYSGKDVHGSAKDKGETTPRL